MADAGSNFQMSEIRYTDKPETGFYKMRLAKGAPMVGAIIFIPCPIDPFYGFPMDRPRHIEAMINGKPSDVDRVWLSKSECITQAEYEYLIADRAWAKEYAPETPEAEPSKALSILEIPIESLLP